MRIAFFILITGEKNLDSEFICSLSIMCMPDYGSTSIGFCVLMRHKYKGMLTQVLSLNVSVT